MPNLPKIIDNKRIVFLDTFKEIAPKYKSLSIATGYWDIEGLKLVMDSIKDYDNVRILIGREPLLKRDNQNKIGVPELDFPDEDFFYDLQRIDPTPELRDVVSQLKTLIDGGKVVVRVYRKNFLHAKCYIFGDFKSETAIGIIGSSNFTRNGMTENSELNALESDSRIVTYKPSTESQEVGHLFWFDEMWNDDKTEDWTGNFLELVRISPVGDLTPSPYEMYIKTLSVLYEDELVPDIELSHDVEKVLYTFQQRNAQLLINKLEKHNLAMLADSVGLGKTITAGAVIKHYIEQGYKRINIIVPAKLSSQWKEDLADIHGLVNSYDIISMQNPEKIKEAQRIDKYANVDLFVIDEAHNLRNNKGKRHEQILEWIANNPSSKVLLMTATPINNQLEDFVSQIQLAGKGNLKSFPVVFKTSDKNEVVDFFDAVKRLSTELKQAEKEDIEPDWDKIHRIMRQGLRQFLVRSTRAGIEKEFGGLMGIDGQLIAFPEGKVIPTKYDYSDKNDNAIRDLLISHREDVFEGVAIEILNQDNLLEVTQRTQHPLDLIKHTESLNSGEDHADVFIYLFRALLSLGFTPYKSETYRHEYYDKDIDTVKSYQLETSTRLKLMSHLSIHNMLRVGLLKRLESSPYSLRKSLEQYKKKISLFRDWLNKGYILNFKQIGDITKEFGENVDVDELPEDIIADKIEANSDKFNIGAMEVDMTRDEKIISVLIDACKILEENDDKLNTFTKLLKKLQDDNVNNGKVLIFSFYADTIEYLSKSIPSVLGDEFMKKAAFVSGSNATKDIEECTRRFAPVAKKQACDPSNEIKHLFATDVLSEGQNLQDCGVIINFDLHWNPVRMIQRNGRVNRLGSPHNTVYVYNLHPEAQLEAYLRLVKRLENKIERIRRSIGTDQSVLGEKENPIEYVENLYSEEATKVALSLEDDEGFLSEDEYVFDLRTFMKDASDEEKKLIQRIPSGKWGHFPDCTKQNADAPPVLSLVRVGIKSDIDKYSADIFVSSDGGPITDPLETLEALSFLKTTPNEKERLVDSFSYDKIAIKKVVEKQAESQATVNLVSNKIKPSTSKVLDELARVFPGMQFQKLMDFSTIQEQKKWNKLMLRSYRELKEHGQMLPQTIADLKRAHDDNITKEERTNIYAESVKSLLYYAK